MIDLEGVCYARARDLNVLCFICGKSTIFGTVLKIVYYAERQTLLRVRETRHDGKWYNVIYLKVKAGMVFKECAETAVLLFGGNGYTRTGQGEIVEKAYRDVMGARIPGGSEDVMLDLAIRQLVKNFKNATAAMERPRGSSRL